MNFAALYDIYWQEHGDAFDRQRLNLLARHLATDELILQVDCGPGTLAEQLAEKGAKVTATELSGEGARRARKRGVNITRANMDTGNLPFPDQSFQAVVCDSRMEHGVRFEHYLDEVVRVLQTGGKIVMSIPNIAHWRCRWWLLRGRFPYVAGTPTDWTHIRFFTLWDMQRLWQERGIQIVVTDGSASLWVDGLYPKWMRYGGVARIYTRLTHTWPSLFARDLVLVGRKSGHG